MEKLTKTIAHKKKYTYMKRKDKKGTKKIRKKNRRKEMGEQANKPKEEGRRLGVAVVYNQTDLSPSASSTKHHQHPQLHFRTKKTVIPEVSIHNK